MCAQPLHWPGWSFGQPGAVLPRIALPWSGSQATGAVELKGGGGHPVNAGLDTLQYDICARKTMGSLIWTVLSHEHYGNVSKKKFEYLHQLLNSFLRLGVKSKVAYFCPLKPIFGLTKITGVRNVLQDPMMIFWRT